MSDDRFAFIVEWYDALAGLTRIYHLMFYPVDNSIEMYDVKNKKTFLKRSEFKSLSIRDFYIGSVLTILSRQLKIADYADSFTKKKFETERGKTYAMIKPDAYTHMGKIIDTVENAGFVISKIKMFKMTLKQSQEFYLEHRGKPFYEELTNFICSDFVIGMELIHEDAIQKWRNLIGPTNCQIARVDAPNSLRALFGTGGVRNACHGSDSNESAQRELNFVFGQKSAILTSAQFTNCSLCIIKPHILYEKKTGRIIDAILGGKFEISALELFNLDKATAEEFLDVYKGVLPEFGQLVDQLVSGPCVAIEIRQENVVQSFRDYCGSYDPEIAKTSKPSSIRARYGIDRVRNAVHCTDLPEDGILESEFFFNILQSKQATIEKLLQQITMINTRRQ